MEYEVKARGRRIVVKANLRIPDDIFEKLRLISKPYSGAGVHNALRTELNVVCNSRTDQIKLLNEFANLLLPYNWE